MAAIEEFELPADLQLGSALSRTLESSNFLRNYNRVSDKLPLSKVIESIENIVDAPRPTNEEEVQAWNLLKYLSTKAELDAEDKKKYKSGMIAQWTGVGGRGRAGAMGYPLFKCLNKALVNDDPEELRLWCPFIRALNNVLKNDRLDRDMVTKRGTKLSQVQARGLRVGQIIRSCMYLATSVPEPGAAPNAYDVAAMFVDPRPTHNVYALFHMERGCMNASPIYKLSAQKNEREVLLQPYTALQVLSLDEGVDHDDKPCFTIVLQVLDNMMVSYYEQDTSWADSLGIKGVPNEVAGRVVCLPM